MIYGVFGDPIAHSLSPLMQNPAFAAAGLDAVYMPFHVVPHELAAAVAGIRALQIGGVNVTLPHKQKIMPLLDRIDADAALVGAVNTVVNRDGELVGYNTDVLGFVRALAEDLEFEPTGRDVMIFGAGGACRAAAVALLRAGARRISIVNRHQERAGRLADEIAPHFSGQQVDVHGLVGAEYLESLSRVDLVVNTTSIGLKGEKLDFCPLEKIKSSASVYDVVYSTAETPFVSASRARGLRAADGIGMLAGQGEEAFALWFGMQPEKGLMKNCLQRLRATKHS